MPRHLALVVAASLLAPSAAGAAQAPAGDPSAYLQAFNDACRGDFPNLDAVAVKAAAQGWQERSMRPTGAPADSLAASLPRAFSRNAMMLFLTRPASGTFTEICQVASSAPTKIAFADLVAAIGPGLSASPPAIVSNREGDIATWQLDARTSFAVSSAKQGKTRTISILARRAR